MTTELVILLSFTVAIMLAVLGGLPSTFEEAAPQYSARLEKQIETGVGFLNKPSSSAWEAP